MKHKGIEGVKRMPGEAQMLLYLLEKAGFEAYVVGGCVRDSMLGLTPKDWDITTIATPEQTKSVFSAYHTIDTGIKHGTVTVAIDSEHFEVTTYRSDGTYSDSRRPDSVTFVHSIEEDLARRDFTVNAMAYSPTRGLVDPFGGQRDLENKLLHCVGRGSYASEERFTEDPLRILRALRFAAKYDFGISSSTNVGIKKCYKLLHNIAMERISVELMQILMYASKENKILHWYEDVILEIIPELLESRGFQQHNPYHDKDVLNHVFHSVYQATPTAVDTTVRLTMLLHDIAKPRCFTIDDNGIGHFYGHPNLGSEMAKEILERMRFDNDRINAVVKLIDWHDCDIPSKAPHTRRLLNKLGGVAMFNKLLEVKRADIRAQSPKFEERLDDVMYAEILAKRVVEEDQCFQLKDLKIGGKDLIAIGVPQGKQIGNILNVLLELVIDGELENTYIRLMDLALDLIGGRDEQSINTTG